MKIDHLVFTLFFTCFSYRSYTMEKNGYLSKYSLGQITYSCICQNNLEGLKEHIKAHNLDFPTIIYVATQNGQTEIVEWLLNNRIYFPNQDINEHQIWYHAVLSGNTELVNLLINKGYNLKPYIQRLPIKDLICKNDTKMIKLLLAQGMNINKQYSWAHTALHFTVLYPPRIALLKLLLNKGANIHIKNDWGHTVLGIAKENNYSVEKDILEHYSNIEKEIQNNPTTELLKIAIEQDFVLFVKRLIQAGIKPTEELLAVAKAHESKEVGQVLVRYLGVTGNQLLLSRSGINNSDHWLPEDITNQIQRHVLD
jgi:ankyrin repeat protein